MKGNRVSYRFAIVLALLLAFFAGSLYAVAEDYWMQRTSGGPTVNTITEARVTVPTSLT